MSDVAARPSPLGLLAQALGIREIAGRVLAQNATIVCPAGGTPSEGDEVMGRRRSVYDEDRWRHEDEPYSPRGAEWDY